MRTVGRHATRWLLLLLVAAPARADDPAPAPAAPAAAAAPAPEAPRASPYRALFPFGPRTLGLDPAAIKGLPERLATLDRALAWLAAHQLANGSWNPANLGWCKGAQQTIAPDGAGKAMYDVGITGMATSLFLVMGHRPGDAGPYASAVATALDWLRGQQDPEGCVGPRLTQHFIYCHAFATLALVEAFGASGDEAVLGSARRALAFSSLARNPYFAWRYGVRPGDNDISATGCMMLPILAAQRINEVAASAGLVEPFAIDEQVFVGVRAWLDRMTDEEVGRVGYITRGSGAARPQDLVDRFPAEESESVTAIGILLRQTLPGGERLKDEDLIAKGVALMRPLAPRWDGAKGRTDLYYWYYGTLAMHLVGGPAWDEWDAALGTALLGSQRRDGDVCGGLGSWDAADPWGPDGGRIYSTCMAGLALTTAWRYPRLPPKRTDLLQALQARSPAPPVLARLLEAVALHRVPGTEKLVADLLKHADPEVRAAAIQALVRVDLSAGAAQAVARLLADPDLRARRAAARAAQELEGRLGPCVAALSERLKETDPVLRLLAAQALERSGAAGASAAEPLRALLADPDPGVRLAAAGALVRLARDPALQAPVLLEGLKHAEAPLRAEACRHLGALGERAHAPALVAVLGETAESVRLRAAQALLALGESTAEAAGVLATLLGSTDAESVRAALRTLAGAGPASAPAIPGAAALALSGSRSLRVEALRFLGSRGAAAAEALPALHYGRVAGRGEVARAAEEALALLALPAEKSIPILTAALESKDERMQDGALAGLAALGSAAVEALSRFAKEEARPVASRCQALRGLAQCGPAAAGAVPVVLDLLDHDLDAFVRAWAAAALAEIGAKNLEVAEALARHVEDLDAGVQRACVRALGKVGSAAPAAAQALVQVAKKTDPAKRELRLEAIRAMGALGAGLAPVFDPLMLLVLEDDSGLSEAALDAFERAGPANLGALRDALKGKSAGFRKGAVKVLRRMGGTGSDAIPELVWVLETPATGLHQEAGIALSEMGKPGLKALTKALKHNAREAREGALMGLEYLGPAAASALPAVKQLARSDPDPSNRMLAERVVTAISPKK